MSARLILVVDNETQTVNLISGTLEPLGYTVVSAASGDEGLAKAKESAPSLILLNLAAPNTDGLRICKAFMSITDTPIILLTMREGKYDPRYKAQYGIVDFMRKPLNAKDVAEKASEHATFIGAAPLVEEEPQSIDAFEIPEEEVPSSHELEESISSYAEDEETLTPIEEEAEVAEVVDVAPEEDVIEAEEAIEVSSEDEIPETVIEAEETVAEIEMPAEELEIPEWPATEEEAPTKEVPAPEWPAREEAEEEEVSGWPATEEEALAEERPTPGWSIPEKTSLGEVPERPAAKEEAPSEETVPEWSLPEEEAATEPEAPTAEDIDWSAQDEKVAATEEDVFEESGVSRSVELDARDFFEDETPPSKDEPIPYEGDITYPSEEAEYEIRPAALERHKRRKSKTRIFIPVLAILLVCAIAGGLFFLFISGKGKLPQLFAPKPSAPIAKKAEPTPAERAPAPPPAPAPAEKASPPAKEGSPLVERKPAAPVATDGRIYYVQFGAFRNKDNANNLQVEIKELGYDTFILESRLKGQPIYLVLLSDKFADKWTAFKQAKQIKNDANIGTSVHAE